MKYTLTLVIAFIAFGLSAQKSQTNEVISLMDSYWEKSEEKTLEKAKKLVDEIFENEEALTNPQSLYAKSQILTAQLLDSTFVEPEEFDALNVFLTDIIETYNAALFHDTRGKYRYKMLLRLYDLKTRLTGLGTERYVEKSYPKSKLYYVLATQLNDLEREFPRVPALDTTVLHTAALVAQLAGDEMTSMELFERLIALEYYKKDVFNQLIALYKKNKFDVKAKKMKIEKNKIFPEN